MCRCRCLPVFKGPHEGSIAILGPLPSCELFLPMQSLPTFRAMSERTFPFRRLLPSRCYAAALDFPFPVVFYVRGFSRYLGLKIRSRPRVVVDLSPTDSPESCVHIREAETGRRDGTRCIKYLLFLDAGALERRSTGALAR